MTIKLPLIESAQNAAIKNLARLQTKKERDAQGRFLVEGLHLLEEAAAAGLLLHIYQLKTLEPVHLVNLCQDGSKTQTPVEVTLCSQAALNRLSAQKSDARYIGLCQKPQAAVLAELANSLMNTATKALLLDGVQDPGNVGTLIRSACSFGAGLVVLSLDCADPYNPKTIQSTQGALFHIPVLTTSLPQVIDALKARAIPVFGAALHQDSIELHELPIPSSFGIIIGNEGRGISKPVLDACTQLVHIEMATFESLNAAIAGSILLYAFQFPSRSGQTRQTLDTPG